MGSPLGRYSEAAALIAALGIVGSWMIVQLAQALGAIAPGSSSPSLDAAAAVAVGLLLGQRSTTNGAGKIAAAAHRRLDAINAPPAELG